MDNLKRFEFNCPFCQQEFYTYVEKDKLIEIYSREKLMQDIFPHYDKEYREIFISKMCPACAESIFGKANKVFVLPKDAPADEDEQLISNIIEMIHDAKRN